MLTQKNGVYSNERLLIPEIYRFGDNAKVSRLMMKDYTKTYGSQIYNPLNMVNLIRTTWAKIGKFYIDIACIIKLNQTDRKYQKIRNIQMVYEVKLTDEYFALINENMNICFVCSMEALVCENGQLSS